MAWYDEIIVSGAGRARIGNYAEEVISPPNAVLARLLGANQ
jgi:hypothetical protein